MKIAVPVTNNNQIEDHFGHCEFYNVYTISENNEIKDIQTLESEQGCGCKSNIASVLKSEGVSVMLAGGIGSGAINVLNSVGINVVRGCSGAPNELVYQYLAGAIQDNGVSCQHHENHHGHDHACNH
jgi:predicted Fe-Mo cluster-binding NifX family protein